MLCRSCKKVRSNRPRGLCYSCYYKPSVRALFPSTSKFARKGAGIGVHCTKSSAVPTEAIPGSEEKIRVLMERVARGEDLWHPSDASLPMPKLEMQSQFAEVA